jgi:hypothetical protein
MEKFFIMMYNKCVVYNLKKYKIELQEGICNEQRFYLFNNYSDIL